ncbi:ATP-grasp domain-containing protein [Candidatus Saccharibacteria bacterium]|nr:ATP-grasp domain-containing protein [Candidatus Saccharibacteria bacterium]
MVLFVNGVRQGTYEALDKYNQRYGKKLSIVVFIDKKRQKKIRELNKQSASKKVVVEAIPFDSPLAIRMALKKYGDRLLAITCQYENAIPYFEKIVPHVPYLDTPTQSSLDWSTDKIMMRKMLQSYDKTLTPKFTVVKDMSEDAISKIEKKVGYPLVIKPSGLAQSLLVSVAYDKNDLVQNLTKTLKAIEKTYKSRMGRGSPRILVEQLMDGGMYSIDVYVNGRGNTYTTPPVHVKTGRAVGFDDFFGYQRLTPTRLLKTHIDDANQAAIKAVKALGLRSTTAHVELIRTNDRSWKIIELAPRMGGYRHPMYMHSFGINHILNDILIRVPQKPIIHKKARGYTAVFNIYAKKEGKLSSITGIPKVKKLNSFKSITIDKLPSDDLKFAKNGGTPVIVLTLFNTIRSDLMADIRRMEAGLVINVTSPVRGKKQ